MAAAVLADCGEHLVAGVVLWACDSLCYCSLGSYALASVVCFEADLHLIVIEWKYSEAKIKNPLLSSIVLFFSQAGFDNLVFADNRIWSS